MYNGENGIKGFNLKREVKLLFSENKPVFCLVSALFVIAVLGGYLYFRFNVDSAMSIISWLLQEKFQNLGQAMEGMHVTGRIGVIFWNNLKVVLISMATGIFLGVFPLVIIFINGLFVGLFTGLIEMEGTSIAKFLVAGVLPHGMFEIPAVIIAGVVGVKMGIIFAFSPDYPSVMHRFQAMARLFIAGFLIVLPLLIIAAIIEMTLTVILVRVILGEGIVL